MGVSFDYTPRLGPQGVEYDPLVDVVFTNPKNGKGIEIRSLIDSGAASIIVSAQFAAPLGLDVIGGRTVAFQGIAHDPVIAYEHFLKMRLKHDSHEYVVPCFLMADLRTTALLGQRGFFENYDILFQLSQKRFELAPRTS
jgi:hypothetical protein